MNPSDYVKALQERYPYNDTRPYKHGGKKL